MEHELEEQIADLIGRRYWEYGIGKADGWCMELARDILGLVAESLHVQMNSTQGHTRDKTAPNAQQNEQDDTKGP